MCICFIMIISQATRTHTSLDNENALTIDLSLITHPHTISSTLLPPCFHKALLNFYLINFSNSQLIIILFTIIIS